MDLFLEPIDNAIAVLSDQEISYVDNKDYPMLSIDLKKLYYEFNDMVSGPYKLLQEL